MIKDWNPDKIKHSLWSMQYEMNSPYNTGFNTWPIKQDLYQLKWQLDKILKEAPTFADEQAWLEQCEKEKMWETLKK